MRALSITIPATEDEAALSPNGTAISPAIDRLLQYSTRPIKSPEILHQSVEESARRAAKHLEMVTAKAREHNTLAATRVRTLESRRARDKENLRQRNVKTMDLHLSRRDDALASRSSHARERRMQCEKEVAAALERKRSRESARAESERRRCEKAEELRQSILASRSHKWPNIRTTTATTRAAVLVPEANEEPNATIAAPQADATPPSTPSARLLAQIDANRRAGTFEGLAAWMQSAATIDLVEEVLCEHGARTEGSPRLVLAILSLHTHSTLLLDPDNPRDQIIAREAGRFGRKLRRALIAKGREPKGETEPKEKPVEPREEPKEEPKEPKPPAEAEPLSASLRRARRFHAAWAAQDKPQTVDFLHATLVARRAREHEQEQAAAGTGGGEVAAEGEATNETIYAQLRAMGGPAAEAQGRAHYAGQWRQVAAADLHKHVASIAERAYWDAVGAHVAEGKYEALWSVLSELQGALKALAAHSERTIDELDDKFDPKFLEQQANHGALETAEVHALMRYLCELIASWQAPVDDAETRRWVASVEASLAGTADQPLADFIGVHMVTFVREAIGRVRRVYERLVALAATAEPANGNAAAAEANADRNAAAADAA